MGNKQGRSHSLSSPTSSPTTRHNSTSTPPNPNSPSSSRSVPQSTPSSPPLSSSPSLQSSSPTVPSVLSSRTANVSRTLPALPRQVLIHILSFLHPRELPSAVCSEWNKLTLEPELWKYFAIALIPESELQMRQKADNTQVTKEDFSKAYAALKDIRKTDNEEEKRSKRLMFACQQRNISESKRLLSEGINPFFGPKAKSIMHSAIDNPSVAEFIIPLLLEDGANPNEVLNVEQQELTAFHLAVKSLTSNIDLLQLFIQKGANVNSVAKKTYMGLITEECPLHTAASLKNLALVKLLLDSGAKVDAMQYIHGASGNYITEKRETALHLLCNAKQDARGFQIAEELIKRGADINSQRKSVVNERPDVHESSKTPVQIAIMYYNTKMVWFLSALGANVNCVSRFFTNDSVRLALYQRWKPELHKYFPQMVKKAILSVLMIAKREWTTFDREIVLRIVAEVACKNYIREDYVDENAAFSGTIPAHCIIK